jgi:hypothetical protein
MSRLPRGFLPIALVVAIISGCDTSSAIFSDAERRSIYSLSIVSESGKALAGASLLPGESIQVSLSNMSGAKAPESLALAVEDAAGQILASLVYATPKASGLGSKPILVDSLSGSLPSFKLPADLAPGVFSLTTSLADASGTKLQSGQSVFFVAAQGFSLGSLSMYPPTPAPSQAVLFSVGVRPGEPASSPWLRWSSEGRTLAEGPLSDGFDKMVWTAPQLDGAYAIKVEVFPSRPMASIDVASPWRQEVKAIVSRDAALGPDEYADGSRLLSHLAFAGDFTDTGSRVQAEAPSAFGKPALEVFPGGFGYRFDESAGVNLPGAIPPQAGGVGSSFSILWRLYTLQPNGELLRMVSPDGSLLFRAGLEAGLPYAESYDQDGRHRSSLASPLSPGLLDLALSFEAGNGKYSLVWSVNGERRSSPSLPMRVFSPSSITRLGGPGSVVGIYAAFAISDDSEGSPPLFLAASLRAWKGNLLLAEGFESTSLPASSQASGAVTLLPRRLGLGPGGRLAFDEEFGLSRALFVSTGFDPQEGGLAVELSDGDSKLLSVESDGEVRRGDGTILGILRPLDEGRLAFTIKALPDGIEIATPGGLVAARLLAKSLPRSLKLALVGLDATRPALVGNLLVRSAPEALTLADAPRTARLR